MKKEVEKMAATTVGDICTKDAKALSPDTPLDEIATIMAEKGLHHLPVVEGGRVVGIVGKHEVIKGVAG
jgi:CBS domain-containing protein